MKTFSYFLLLGALVTTQLGYGQADKANPFPYVGKVKPRHSQEIAASNWSIGGETLDRGYSDFDQWKQYLGPLGAKKVRLQAGWARCEKQKGVYDFVWLDAVIDEVIAQGLEPWLQTSYGNPIYEGGGDIFLGAGFPVSAEAWAAWDKWVYALSHRYKGRVHIWEVWNESDLNQKNSAEDYAKLFVRTAEIIRATDPDATLYALSLANPWNIDYVEIFLDYLKSNNKLHLVDVITLHGYSFIPEGVHDGFAKVRNVVRGYSDQISIAQGELGCPSENQPFYALSKYDWTETSQSKWLLRRLLGDLGHDIPALYFSIIDLNYVRRYENVKGVVTLLKEPIYTVNTKGLIKAKKDNTVDYLKPAYSTFQNVTSIFDFTLVRIPNYPYTSTSDSSLSVFGYRRQGTDLQVVTVWIDSAIPGNSQDKIQVTFDFGTGNFNDPVWVDMRTGEVFDIPAANWKQNGTAHTFTEIPVYDSPILIADRSLISIQK